MGIPEDRFVTSRPISELDTGQEKPEDMKKQKLKRIWCE